MAEVLQVRFDPDLGERVLKDFSLRVTGREGCYGGSVPKNWNLSFKKYFTPLERVAHRIEFFMCSAGLEPFADGPERAHSRTCKKKKRYP